MGDQVERALEETVPLLRQVRKLKLLSHTEIESNVRKRRDHEYTLRRPTATRAEFLKYAAFERETADVLKARAEAKNLPEKRVRSITAQQSARVNLVYSRAIRKFKGDDALYLHYARHCVSTGSRRAAEKVLARAIAHRGDSEQVWLAAAAFHFDACGDIKVARGISQRGLRALEKSKLLWREYFRMELAYLAKLVARRSTIGASVPEGGEKSTDVPVPNVDASGGGTESVDGADSPAAGDAGDAPKLQFWDGGVSYAVFKSAVHKAQLDVDDAASYLQLASSMPFAPPLLLKRLADDIRTQFNSIASPYARALLLRNEFDLACVRLLRKRAGVNGSRGGDKEPQESIAEECVFANLSSNVAQLAEQLVADLEDLQGIGDTGSSSHTLVSQVVSEVLSRLLECGPDTVIVEKLRTRCDLVLGRSDHQAMSSSASEAIPLSLEGVKSSKDWSLFLEASSQGTSTDAHLATRIRTKLSEAALVPFRSAEVENICVLWFQWEASVDELRKAYSSVLSMPPVTLNILQAAIEAERSLAGLNATPAVPDIRRLYKQAIRLPVAKTDVDLWLAYFRFERDIAGDASLASNVSWSAKRTLDGALSTLFEEKCMLLNLR